VLIVGGVLIVADHFAGGRHTHCDAGVGSGKIERRESTAIVDEGVSDELRIGDRTDDDAGAVDAEYVGAQAGRIDNRRKGPVVVDETLNPS
jgi:hypothetical protein